MTELVPDPGFNDPSKWDFVGFGASITDGQLRFANAIIPSSNTIPPIVPTVDQTYKYKIVVERAPATPFKTEILFGGVKIYNTGDGAGTFEDFVTPINTNGLIFLAQFVGQWYLDSISISVPVVEEPVPEEEEPMAEIKVSKRRPTSRKVSARGLVYALAGREKPYNAYRFGAVDKYERPSHNPFKGL